MIDFKIIDSGKKGTNLVVFGCIHGNEIAGFKAISHILEMFDEGKIKLLSGKVTFIPIANKKAFELGKRYVDVNLNRVFKKHENPTTYEEKIANELTTFIDKNDILLDVHSSHTDDEPFIFLDYFDDKNTYLAKSCGIKNIIIGWPQIYENTGSSDTCSYTNYLGKTGVTVECGNHFKNDSVDVGIQAILGVLQSYNMIDYNIKKLHIFNKLEVKEFFTKKYEGKLFGDFKFLDLIKKGEVIGVYDNGTQIKAPYDAYFILPYKDAKIGDEWFYLGVKKD